MSNLKNNELLNIFSTIITVFFSALILKRFEKLSLLNLFILIFMLFLFFKINKLRSINFDTLTPLLTIMLMCWSVISSSFEYLVYQMDWNIFSIPINLNLSPDLYKNDLLAKQEFPHKFIYEFVSLIIKNDLLSELFFIGFILQNLLLLKAFEALYKRFILNSKNNFEILLIAFPLFFYPQSSGHFTSLPWFLPSIAGYSISVYLLTRFIFVKQDYIGCIFLILLIFIHPFWGMFVPLYLFLIYIFSKDKQIYWTISFIVATLFSLILNNSSGLSINNTLNKSWVDFAKEITPIHHDWINHAGYFLNGHLNLIYQLIPLVTFVLLLIYKNKFFDFSTRETTFFASLGLINLVIIFGILFRDTVLNELLISVNFHRIGSISWFFLGVFVFRMSLNKKLTSLILFLPYLIFILNTKSGVKKITDIFPNIEVSSKYTYFFLILSTLFFIKNKVKISMFINFIGTLYFFVFYFIGKNDITNYFVFSIIFCFFLVLIYIGTIFKLQIKSEFLAIYIILLFSIVTFRFENLVFDLRYDYQSVIDKNNIELIKNNTSVNSVILYDPSASYFRKETQRGLLIDYGLIPYNIQNAELYNKYKNYFNGKNITQLTTDEILIIINNTNVTDMILPKENLSNEYFKNEYEFIYLPKLGFLYKEIGN